MASGTQAAMAPMNVNAAGRLTSKDDQALVGVLRAITVELAELQECRNELRDHVDRIMGSQPEKDESPSRPVGSQFGGTLGEIESGLIALNNTRGDIVRLVARLRAL